MAHHSKAYWKKKYAMKSALEKDGDNVNKALSMPAGAVYTALNCVSTVTSGSETGKCRVRQGCWKSISSSIPDWKLK